MDFDAIYTNYSRMVYWAAYNVTKNHDTALDVSQEVFVRVLKHLGSLKGYDDARIKRWLYRVAVNASLDILRKNKSETLYDEPPYDAPTDCRSELPEEAAESNEQNLILKRCIDKLDEHYRTPVMLHYFSGLGYSEIASMLGVAEGTVKSRISRAKTMLASDLKREGIDYGTKGQ